MMLLGGFCRFSIGIVLSHNLLVDFFDVFLARHGAVGIGVVGATVLGKVVGARKGLVAEGANVGALGSVGTDVSEDEC